MDTYSTYITQPAPSENTYTTYAAYVNSEQEESSTAYTSYLSFIFQDDRTLAGFTSELPEPPVPQTSYHLVLENGYAPYQTCRVLLN